MNLPIPPPSLLGDSFMDLLNFSSSTIGSIDNNNESIPLSESCQQQQQQQQLLQVPQQPLLETIEDHSSSNNISNNNESIPILSQSTSQHQQQQQILQQQNEKYRYEPPPPSSPTRATSYGSNTVSSSFNSTTSNNNNVQSFQKLKMRLGSPGCKLYGRENEEEILRQAFFRTIRDNIQEFILISGIQGSGKTSLMNTLRQTVSHGKQGYYVNGKFDNVQQTSTSNDYYNRPYEVFILCLINYIDQLFDSTDQNRIDEIRKIVKQAIGNDSKILSDMIPTLKSFFEMSIGNDQQSNIASTPNNSLTSSNGGSNNITAVNTKGTTNGVNGGVNMNKSYGIIAQIKFRSLFCKLIRSLTQIAPLVLVLDDIHWADTASCEMIKALIQYGGGMKLLLIGAHQCVDFQLNNRFNNNNTNNNTQNTNNNNNNTANNNYLNNYRGSVAYDNKTNKNGGTIPSTLNGTSTNVTNSNTLDAQQSSSMACMQMKPFLATMIELTRERYYYNRNNNANAIGDNNTNIRIRTIEMNDLKSNSICDMLQDLLGKTGNDIQQLSDIVIKQTNGNIFHILQFLRLLLDQQFLTKNIEDKWIWDNNIIISKLNPVTIKDMIHQTILSLPRLGQETLKIAACMGDEIDDSAIDIILQVTSVGQYLDLAANEGLIVFYSYSGGYKFAHDWIRQTIYELIPNNEREEFHLKIGRKLWKSASYNPILIQKNIFIIVTLLNIGIKYMKEERERYRVAELNLLAAMKACEVSAYPNASQFCRKGILLLSNKRWTDYYDVTLSLFSLAAEVEVKNGNYERVVLYIEEIMKKGVSLEDKLRAYAALIKSMIQQNNLQEAYAVGIDVLRQLGEKFPKPSKFYIMKKLTRVGMLLRGKTNHDILQLPLMKNTIRIQTLKILNLLFLSSYQARVPIASLLAFRAVTFTLQYGIDEASSVSFAAYSMILCGLKFDLKAARKYSEVAISLAENMHSRIYTPVVYYLVGSGVAHWCYPMRETFDDLIYSSKTAMEVADAETAVVAKVTKCIHGIFCGDKLIEIEEEIDQCIRAARLYRKQSALTYSLIVLQLIECWIGKVKNPAILDGVSVSFPRVLKECEDANNRIWISIIYFFSVELAYNFGDYELAARMSEESTDIIIYSMFFHVECTFKEGLNGVAMARKGLNKSKNMKIAKDSLKRLTEWVKLSPLQQQQQGLRAKQLLLDAEIQSLKGHKAKNVVYPIYEKSFKEMKEVNLRNEIGLIAERFADYKVVCGDTKDAIELYRRAKEIYLDWGAIAKLSHLNSVISTLEK